MSVTTPSDTVIGTQNDRTRARIDSIALSAHRRVFAEANDTNTLTAVALRQLNASIAPLFGRCDELADSTDVPAITAAIGDLALFAYFLLVSDHDANTVKRFLDQIRGHAFRLWYRAVCVTTRTPGRLNIDSLAEHVKNFERNYAGAANEIFVAHLKDDADVPQNIGGVNVEAAFFALTTMALNMVLNRQTPNMKPYALRVLMNNLCNGVVVTRLDGQFYVSDEAENKLRDRDMSHKAAGVTVLINSGLVGFADNTVTVPGQTFIERMVVLATGSADSLDRLNTSTRAMSVEKGHFDVMVCPHVWNRAIAGIAEYAETQKHVTNIHLVTNLGHARQFVKKRLLETSFCALYTLLNVAHHTLCDYAASVTRGPLTKFKYTDTVDNRFVSRHMDEHSAFIGLSKRPVDATKATVEPREQDRPYALFEMYETSRDKLRQSLLELFNRIGGLLGVFRSGSDNHVAQYALTYSSNIKESVFNTALDNLLIMLPESTSDENVDTDGLVALVEFLGAFSVSPFEIERRLFSDGITANTEINRVLGHVEKMGAGATRMCDSLRDTGFGAVAGLIGDCIAEFGRKEHYFRHLFLVVEVYSTLPGEKARKERFGQLHMDRQSQKDILAALGDGSPVTNTGRAAQHILAHPGDYGYQSRSAVSDVLSMYVMEASAREHEAKFGVVFEAMQKLAESVLTLLDNRTSRDKTAKHVTGQLASVWRGSDEEAKKDAFQCIDLACHIALKNAQVIKARFKEKIADKSNDTSWLATTALYRTGGGTIPDVLHAGDNGSVSVSNRHSILAREWLAQYTSNEFADYLLDIATDTSQLRTSDFYLLFLRGYMIDNLNDEKLASEFDAFFEDRAKIPTSVCGKGYTVGGNMIGERFPTQAEIGLHTDDGERLEMLSLLFGSKGHFLQHTARHPSQFGHFIGSMSRYTQKLAEWYHAPYPTPFGENWQKVSHTISAQLNIARLRTEHYSQIVACGGDLARTDAEQDLIPMDPLVFAAAADELSVHFKDNAYANELATRAATNIKKAVELGTATDEARACTRVTYLCMLLFHDMMHLGFMWLCAEASDKNSGVSHHAKFRARDWMQKGRPTADKTPDMLKLAQLINTVGTECIVAVWNAALAQPSVSEVLRASAEHLKRYLLGVRAKSIDERIVNATAPRNQRLSRSARTRSDYITGHTGTLGKDGDSWGASDAFVAACSDLWHLVSTDRDVPLHFTVFVECLAEHVPHLGVLKNESRIEMATCCARPGGDWRHALMVDYLRISNGRPGVAGGAKNVDQVDLKAMHDTFMAAIGSASANTKGKADAEMNALMVCAAQIPLHVGSVNKKADSFFLDRQTDDGTNTGRAHIASIVAKHTAAYTSVAHKDAYFFVDLVSALCALIEHKRLASDTKNSEMKFGGWASLFDKTTLRLIASSQHVSGSTSNLRGVVLTAIHTQLSP
jgi:hypothetical protein